MEATLFIVGLVVPLALSYWLRPRSVRKRRQQADAHFRDLVRWATEHPEWRVVEGIDLHFAEIADRITGLVGVPRDWAFSHGARDPTRDDPTIAGTIQKWSYGPILVRTVAAGELIIVDCWPDGDGSFHVFAAMDTDGVFSPYTLDLLLSDEQRIYVQGKPPITDEELDLPELLEGLPRPVRLRLLNRQLLLYARGQLSIAMVELIAERLQALHAHLPSRPDRGPMR